MNASPLQLSICATCALLLLAKVREWWQGLAHAPALPPVWQLTVPPLTAHAPAAAASHAPALHVAPQVPVPPPHAAPAATYAAPAPAALQAPVPPATSQAETPTHPAPAWEPGEPADSAAPEPVRPDFAAHTTPRFAGPEPAQEASDLQRQLADLAERELAAARLRARSVKLNAETQARAIVEEGERTAAAQLERHLKAAPRPPTVDLNAAHRQGLREAHAIGLRKGEIDALGRIEQVFHQMEALLSVDPRDRVMVTSPSLSFEPGREGK